MAEKASLMIEAAKLEESITNLAGAIDKKRAEIDAIPTELSRAQQEAWSKAQASFLDRQSELRDRVTAVVSAKRKAVAELIDSFPDKDVQEYAGRFEIKELEDHLMEVYPAEMIENYVCLDPIPLDDQEEAFRMYSSIESMIMSLSKGGGVSATVFNGLTAILDAMTENPQLGMKSVPAIIIFYIVSVLFLPFVFLTAFSIMGFAAAARGIFVKSILRKLYSVKIFLNQSYDEDIFQMNKSDIMGRIDAYLDGAQQEYIDTIDTNRFVYDQSIDKDLEKKADLNKKRLEQSIALDTVELQNMKQQLSDLLDQIEELEDAERKKAENARKRYLETVSWEHAWMEHAFIDVTPENKLLMMPFAKANSCYYSKDEDTLKQFSRLLTFQAMLRMHPEYATQVVLDYKYMGGDLTQFLTLEGKCIKLCFSEEDLRKQQDIISNEIKARTKSILSSSANLDEFNALMATYDSTGEYYAIIHIFGLESINGAMKNWFRNGPRVGYIFKFYMTFEEMQQLKDDLPLSDIKDFYEIRENPLPRTASAVKRIVGLD